MAFTTSGKKNIQRMFRDIGFNRTQANNMMSRDWLTLACAGPPYTDLHFLVHANPASLSIQQGTRMLCNIKLSDAEFELIQSSDNHEWLSIIRREHGQLIDVNLAVDGEIELKVAPTDRASSLLSQASRVVRDQEWAITSNDEAMDYWKDRISDTGTFVFTQRASVSRVEMFI